MFHNVFEKPLNQKYQQNDIKEIYQYDTTKDTSPLH